MNNFIALTLVGCLLTSTVFAQAEAVSNDAPIEISADEALEWHRDKQSYIAKGNAIAIQGDKRIKSDTLTAHYAESQTGDTEITKMIAVGNVEIKTDTDTAYGDHGEYDVLTEIVTLTGNVKIHRDENILNGDRAVVNLKTGISKLLSDKKSGRVSGTFFPKKK
jgi:lipopolysaccharide export system protein LptA